MSAVLDSRLHGLLDYLDTLRLPAGPTCSCLLALDYALPHPVALGRLLLARGRGEANVLDIKDILRQRPDWAGRLANHDELAPLMMFEGRLDVFIPTAELVATPDALFDRISPRIRELILMFRISAEVLADDPVRARYAFQCASAALTRRLGFGAPNPIGLQLKRHVESDQTSGASAGLDAARRWVDEIRTPSGPVSFASLYAGRSVQLALLAQVARLVAEDGPLGPAALGETDRASRDALIRRLRTVLREGIEAAPEDRGPLLSGLVGGSDFRPPARVVVHEGLDVWLKWLRARAEKEEKRGGKADKPYQAAFLESLRSLRLVDMEEGEMERFLGVGFVKPRDRLSVRRKRRSQLRAPLPPAPIL